MNIGYLVRSFSTRAGTESYVYHMAKALAAQGHHVHIVSSTGKGAWDFGAFEDRISVHQFELRRIPFRTIRKLEAVLPLSLWRYGRAIRRRLPSIVAAHAIDLVEATDWGMDAWAYLPIRKIPVCVRLHGYPGFKGEFDRKLLKKGPKNYLNWVIQRNHIAGADLVTGVSEAYAAFVRQAWEIEAKPMQIVPISVDLEVFHPAALPREERSVLFAGRLEESKGIEVLDQAIAIVRRQMPGVKFYFAGADYEYKETKQTWSQHLTRQHGPDTIVFLGSLPTRELVRRYQQSTLCILPSLYEPGGTVAFEAMACGCPVLASRAGGLTEVIQDGQTGVLTPPGDAAALAEKLLELLKNPQLRLELSRRAIDSIHRKYNLATIAQQTLAAYAKAIEAFRTLRR